MLQMPCDPRPFIQLKLHFCSGLHPRLHLPHCLQKQQRVHRSYSKRHRGRVLQLFHLLWISLCLQKGTAERHVLRAENLSVQGTADVELNPCCLQRLNMQVGRRHMCCSDSLPAEAQAALLMSWSLQAGASLLSMLLPSPPLCRGWNCSMKGFWCSSRLSLPLAEAEEEILLVSSRSIY